VGARSGKLVEGRVWGDGRKPNPNTVSNNSNSTITHLTGSQVTESETHAGWQHHVRGVVTADQGGPFTTIKQQARAFQPKSHKLSGFKTIQPVDGGGYNWAFYDGPYFALPPSLADFPSHAYSSDSTLERLGTTAIARCAPTNPTADASTFLGELLHDGIPTITLGILKEMRGMSNRQRRRAIGDQYLNYEFGWKPFVNDIRSIANAVIHSHAVLRQFERDSGKLVRRRYEFPPTEKVVSTVFSNGASPWLSPSSITLTDGSLPKGQVIRVDKTTQRQWFSGAFSYYIPSGTTARGSMARSVIGAKKTLGISLTPDSIWNLTPWSWAVDWFSNAGDVLKNLDAWILDNQVLWYGYMMEHTIVERTYTFVGPTGYQSKHIRPDDIILVSEAKIRRKATPFGFGFNWDGLSSFQKTIIAALGLSRS